MPHDEAFYVLRCMVLQYAALKRPGNGTAAISEFL